MNWMPRSEIQSDAAHFETCGRSSCEVNCENWVHGERTAVVSALPAIPRTAGAALVMCATVLAGCSSGNTPTNDGQSSVASPATTEAQAPGSSAQSTPAQPTEQSSEASEGTPPGASVYQSFGTFVPVTRSGSGDGVVRLGDAQDAVALAMTATHHGTSDFSISTQDSQDADMDSEVHTVGAYSGTTCLLVFRIASKLRIKAEGPWTVTLTPIAELKEVSPPVQGNGDSVFLFSGPAQNWKITYTGGPNFVVRQYTYDGNGFPDENLLINNHTTGILKRTVSMLGGPSVVYINAEGNWSVREA